jgi:hypothetical protein
VPLARLVLLAVALLNVSLTTIGCLDPPDPTWIAGYWDDDDFDSAVDSILHSSAVEPAAPAGAHPRWVAIARVDRLEVSAVPLSVAILDSPRGPPGSLAVI